MRAELWQGAMGNYLSCQPIVLLGCRRVRHTEKEQFGSSSSTLVALEVDLGSSTYKGEERVFDESSP